MSVLPQEYILLLIRKTIKINNNYYFKKIYWLGLMISVHVKL